MRQRDLLISAAIMFAASVMAQRTPSHPLDIKQGQSSLSDALPTWEPGQPPSGTDKYDDQFYISRVRPLERLSAEDDYQVNSTVDKDRKFCLWTPCDDPSTTWKSLPRYCFEGDNFSMWQYTDIHGNWTAPWIRVSAGIMDAAHKNGTSVGCVLSVPWGSYVTYGSSGNDYSKLFTVMMEKDASGNFKYAAKLAKLMKYYGIDGIGCNSEFSSNSSTMKTLMEFVKACKAEAKKIGWHFQLHWYDGTCDTGRVYFDRGLGSQNDGIFGSGDSPVTDMLFFNYNWNYSILANSEYYAKKINRSSYDLYAGFDIQGRALNNNNWGVLKNSKISVGFWGAHAQSLLHQSATDDGSSDYAIQNAYQKKLELVFSGGNRNPGLTPPIITTMTLGNGDLTKFHGLAQYVTAKSTLQQLPFVTRFNLGNGLKFRKNGAVTFDHKWYNLSMQDFLPTWRFWITDAQDQVTEESIKGLVNAKFTFDDAYFGGSCLQLSGATTFSRVKLFKTKFDVKGSNKLSIVYKVVNGDDPKAKVFLARKGALTTYLEVELPKGKQGEWTKATFNLSDFGINDGDVVSMVGISVANTDSDYNLLLGELSIVDPDKTYGTVTPTIQKVDILRRRYNQIDFKLFYQSRDESDGVKTYNDEVGTWYYEIWMQQEGEEAQLLTSTTSWGAYVIDGPLNSKGSSNVRFGVRAIAPDGSDSQPIQWSEYQEATYNDPLETIVIDKPVVKPNEEFVIKYLDEMHSPAKEWKIVDPVTGEVVGQASDATQVKLSIAQTGLYDLQVTDDKGVTTITRGFVQITPEETGAVPQLADFTADNTTPKVEDVVKFNYTSKDGEGSVSRALRIEDPQMFCIPAAAQTGKTYSYALWFKVNKFSHDKQGTNLINKNTVADTWPHNNWGDLWVTIRPNNEISFNTMGWTEHDNPNPNMKSTGFVVTPGVWNHLVVTQDDGNNQTMYFNGKKVAETNFSSSTRREQLGQSDGRIMYTTPANIYIGGGNVYKAGFDGWIDEVQVWNKELRESDIKQVMQGYQVAPDQLIAYYTFEEVKGSGDNRYFENKGRGISGKNLNGKVVKIINSGGEKTADASYVPVDFSNEELGYPGITGSLQITTTPTWTLDGATVKEQSNADKQISVTYSAEGKYNASLKLENMWGKAELTKPEYIVIGTTGIDDLQKDNFSVGPNPFVESLSLRFVEGGTYSMLLYNANGQLVNNKTLLVSVSGQVVNMTVNGPSGVYILKVKKNGKDYQTVKLLKQ